MEEFGWPMGPAYLQDVVGMDTLLHVLDTISAGFAPRMQLDFPHAVRLFVDRGRLGQKSGVGFYRYETDPKGRPRKSVDPDTVALLASVQPNGPRNFTAAELRERLMLPMIIEAIRCLEEGIVGSAAEVDLSNQPPRSTESTQRQTGKYRSTGYRNGLMITMPPTSLP